MVWGRKTYARLPGPYQTLAAQIYDELRQNVIDNVFKVRLVTLSPPCSIVLPPPSSASPAWSLARQIDMLTNGTLIDVAGVRADGHCVGAV